MKFETNSPGDNFCDAKARGHLLYGGENDLMLCDGHSWKGLMAAQKPKLNFVEKIGNFEPREPILHSSHFSIPGEGYFMGKIDPRFKNNAYAGNFFLFLRGALFRALDFASL